jgi:hypothetical protein
MSHEQDPVRRLMEPQPQPSWLQHHLLEPQYLPSVIFSPEPIPRLLEHVLQHGRLGSIRWPASAAA